MFYISTAPHYSLPIKFYANYDMYIVSTAFKDIEEGL